ncbi:MAG: ABC transporter permease subunit [Myxococcales bacterium]|jgi:ABC-type transport system involved in multi-copper enzyme maturation permease subunit
MHRIVAVAVNTFREAVRDRVLYGVLGVASAVLVFTLVLAEVSLDQQRRIVLDVGLASISLFSVLVAIFLGSSLLYKEIERKTLYVILPKPIRRHEFLLGKYFGIALTAFVFVCIMGAIQLLVTAVQAGAHTATVVGVALALPAALGLWVWKAHDRTAAVVPWSLLALGVSAMVANTADLELLPVLSALTLNIGEVLLLTSVALFFSSFSTPFLTALFTFGVWVVGRSADVMVTMKSKTIPQAIKDILAQLVGVWPNFNLFVPGRHTLETQLTDTAGPLTYVGNNLLYAVGYSFIVLTLAARIFQRRDFL